MRAHVSVRFAAVEDVDALLVLFDEVASERLYLGTEPGYDRELYRSRFERMLQTPNRTPLFVAYCADLLIGQLSVYESQHYGSTIAMMVTASFRGRGVGRMLLHAALDWAGTNAIEVLSLLVFAHNERALALYRAEGFEEVERYAADVVRQSGEVWDTVLMQKRLVRRECAPRA